MSSGPRLSIIVAASRNGVIGAGGGLPWRLPTDMKFFKETTLGHHVIMGRKTWDSLPKPLPGRTNVVVTRQEDFVAEQAVVVHGLAEAMALVASSSDDEAYIIGGAQLYAEALRFVSRIYLTRVDADVEGDVYFAWPGAEGWVATSLMEQGPDARHEFGFTIWRYDRVDGVDGVDGVDRVDRVNPVDHPSDGS